MKIRVDPLTATPTGLRFEEDTSWWRTHMPRHGSLPDAFASPLVVDVTAYTMGEDLLVEGDLSGAFELECSRCLARYRHDLRESFRLVLEPAGSRVPTDPEAAAALARDGLCVGDEFETGWYRGGEIQLDSVCLEVISLALPVKPLCRSECAGLCARCGSDLNDGACSCPEVEPESPFAVLASLRGGEVEGAS